MSTYHFLPKDASKDNNVVRSKTPEQINNEKKFSDFMDKLNSRKKKLNNSNYSEIISKLKKYYSKYYEQGLNNQKQINNQVNQIRQKYIKNSNVSHNLLRNIAPRPVKELKQDIYMKELENVIQFLYNNIENLDLFPDFLSIILFVANKRKIIEYLKLSNNFHLFGSLRTVNKLENGRKAEFRSYILNSSGAHLLNNNKLVSTKITYYNDKLKIKRNLTKIRINDKNSHWVHSKSRSIPKLLYLMNELYKKFKKSLLSGTNIKESKDLLCELYWLYIQACPFERGSAAIGEIIFSALLQKHFGYNFKLLTKKYNPRYIPDIHALTYPLEKFKTYFWEKLVSRINNSGNQSNSNNNSGNQSNSNNNSGNQSNSNNNSGNQSKSKRKKKKSN
jgi:hypothetical protein